MSPKKNRIIFFILLGLTGLAITLGLTLTAGNPQPAFAQENATPTPDVDRQVVPGNGHSDCLGCHSNPDMMGKFTNGDTVPLYYDQASHADSVHVDRGLGCRACHSEQGNYPHPLSSEKACATCHWQVYGGSQPSAGEPLVFDIPLETPRDLTLQLNQSCAKCHTTQSQEESDSAHHRILENGNPYAPVCVDCHGSHDVKPVAETQNPEVCAKCHEAVYTSYKTSVHGAALEETGNPDVPTCGTCHGVHVMRGPEEENFRADSIELCGQCHADENLMSKYGISTDVFTTYIDDFHGRSVDYSRQSGSGVDKATCYDCHGVHNILPPDNENSTVYPANLQATCQRCHADADITFPEAWLSHKVPDWKNAVGVFIVNQVYKLLIPLVIGGFIVYIALDAFHRIKVSLKKNK